MKIKQLFCTHKEQHFVGYDVICDIFTHKVYEKRKVYKCNKCGKQFLQKVKSKNEEI